MEMILNGYIMMIYPNFYVFIQVPVIVGCWVMVSSLSFKSLCDDTLWTYKGEKFQDAGRGYSGESSYTGYSGCSGGGCTADGGTGGCIYTGYDGLYVGHSGGYSGEGERNCGRYEGDDKTGGGDQVVETMMDTKSGDGTRTYMTFPRPSNSLAIIIYNVSN